MTMKLDVVTIYQDTILSLIKNAKAYLLRLVIPVSLLFVLNDYCLKLPTMQHTLQIAAACIDILFLTVIAFQIHRLQLEAGKQNTATVLREYVLGAIVYMINFGALIAIIVFPFIFYISIYLFFNGSNTFGNPGQLNASYATYYVFILITAYMVMRLLLILPAIAIHKQYRLSQIWTLTRGHSLLLLAVESVPLVIIINCIYWITTTQSHFLLSLSLLVALISFVILIALLSQTYIQLDRKKRQTA